MPQVLGASQESSSTRLGPRLWRKHLLPFGSWLVPGSQDERFEITPEVAKQIKENFDRRVLDVVPTPSGHTDDWEANKGEVVGLEVHPENGLYATLKFSDEETDQAVEKGLLKGVSAWFSTNYLDKKSGERVGPVLRHAALTNVPYIKGMEPFEAVLSEAGYLDSDDTLVALSEYEPPTKEGGDPLTLEELLAKLRDDHGIDVEALKTSAERAEAFDTGVSKLREAGLALSEDASPDDVVAAVAALKSEADEKKSTEVKLAERVESLEQSLETERKNRSRENAERMVAPYIAAGKVTASEKDQVIELAESNPELAKSMLSKLSDNVLLSETGSAAPGEDPDADDGDPDAEVSRLVGVGRGAGLRTRVKED